MIKNKKRLVEASGDFSLLTQLSQSTKWKFNEQMAKKLHGLKSTGIYKPFPVTFYEAEIDGVLNQAILFIDSASEMVVVKIYKAKGEILLEKKYTLDKLYKVVLMFRKALNEKELNMQCDKYNFSI